MCFTSENQILQLFQFHREYPAADVSIDAVCV